MTSADGDITGVHLAHAKGEPALEALERAISDVQSLLPYLRAEIAVPALEHARGNAPGEGDRLPCEALITDEDLLEFVIRDSGERLGTDDLVVAASLFVQNYAYRIITLAVACLTTSGVIPDSSAKSMTFTMKGGRPAIVGYLSPPSVLLAPRGSEPAVAMSDPECAREAISWIIAGAYRNHLAQIVAATRAQIRVGRRLLLGNVAASSAVAFRTMEGCLGPWVQPLGETFFRMCPSELDGLGSFLSLERGDRHGWYWERTNCCLYDRLPGKVRCADCSRIPSAERRHAYWDSLEPS